jgi:hypothetical protein
MVQGYKIYFFSPIQMKFIAGSVMIFDFHLPAHVRVNPSYRAFYRRLFSIVPLPVTEKSGMDA